MVDGYPERLSAYRETYQYSLGGKLIGSTCDELLLSSHRVQVGWVENSQTTQLTNEMVTRGKRRIIVPAECG